MITKHFFKVLVIFIMMIALGMAGILLVSSYDDKQQAEKTASTPVPCAGKNC